MFNQVLVSQKMMSHSKSMLTIHIHQYQNTMFISYTYMYVMYTNKTDEYFDFNFLISSNISTLFENYLRYIGHLCLQTKTWGGIRKCNHFVYSATFTKIPGNNDLMDCTVPTSIATSPVTNKSGWASRLKRNKFVK